MNDPLPLLLAFTAGAGLGAFFFGGLWWTVRRGVSVRQPALWFLGSMLLRTAIALTGFYVVAGTRWERLLACFAGFILARLVVTRLTGPPVSNFPPKEADHAAQSR